MKIIQNCSDEEIYGEVKFTLSSEEINKIIKSISGNIYSSNGRHDTMLKEDGKLLLWLLTTPKDFTSETLIYCKQTLDRVKHWLK